MIWITILSIIFVNLLIKLPYINVPLDRDYGIYGYHGLFWLNKKRKVYVDTKESHPPGRWLLYGLLLKYFGLSRQVFRISSLIFLIGTNIILFLSSLQLFDFSTAVLIAGFFALLSSAPVFVWIQSNDEIEQTFFSILSVYLILISHENSWVLIFAGLSCFGSLLFKQSAYINTFPIVFIILFLYNFSMLNLTILIIGISLGYLLTYLFLKNEKIPTSIFLRIFALNYTSLKQFIINLQYHKIQNPGSIDSVYKEQNIGAKQTNSLKKNVDRWVKQLLFHLAKQSLFFIIIIIGSIVFSIIKFQLSIDIIVLFVWLFFVILTISLNKHLMPYHFIPLLVPLSWLSGMGLMKLIQDYHNFNSLFTLLFYVIGLTSLIFTLYQYKELFTNREKVYFNDDDEFIFNKIGEKLGLMIKEKTDPDDNIYVWGPEYEVYLWAERHTSVDTLFCPRPEVNYFSDPKKMEKIIISQLENNLPKYIIITALSTGFNLFHGLLSEKYDLNNIVFGEIKIFKLKIEFIKEKSISESKIINVLWEGPMLACLSLAAVNRELCRLLLNEENINLSIKAKDPEILNCGYKNNNRFNNIVNHIDSELHDKIDVHIRHEYPPILTPPKKGHWVTILPWEFGFLPKNWTKIFIDQVDEMWVPSNYVKEVYMNSGIPSERVIVVPNGIDPEIYNPNVAPYKLKTTKKFKFLFVGGTIFRKGIDILLKSYTNAFSNKDDVCLVIKDMGTQSFYKKNNSKDKILKLMKDKTAPEIEYIDELLPEKELVGLYTACNILVLPYRGEGFGLPILEAMACGTTPLVTNGGACLDFCNEQNAILINARVLKTDVDEIGGKKLVKNAWIHEPDKNDLVNKMKWVVEFSDQIKKMGKVTSETIRKEWTWDKSVNIVAKRLRIIKRRGIIRELSVNIKKADSMLLNNKPNKALKIYSSIANNHKIFEAYWGQVLSYQILGNVNEARKTLYHIIEETMQKAKAYNQLGVLSYNEENFENAKIMFLKSINEDSEFLEAKRNLAELFLDTEQYEKGLEIFYSILKKYPENIPTLLRMAEINIEAGKHGNAEKYLAEVHELDPINKRARDLDHMLDKNVDNKTNENLLFQEIIDARNNNDNNTAIQLIDELLELNQEHIKALNIAGMIFYEEKDFEKAKDAFRRVIEIDPIFLDAQKNLADVLLELEDYEESINILFEILAKNPNDIETSLKLAELSIEAGQYENALTYIKQVQDIDPNNELAKFLGKQIIN